MIFKPDTLICTAGTSLLESNLRPLPDTREGFEKLLAGRYHADQQILQGCWPQVHRIKCLHSEKRWRALGEALAGLPDTVMLCGAEINSIAAMLQKSYLSLERLLFLVSDTAAGTDTGEVLKHYYLARKKELGLKYVHYRKVASLQDESPGDFRVKGLRNLVREMGRAISEAGGTGRVAVNATGGYKAQIAIAALLGQALDIPVYYKHERFFEIISFPPMPVTLDYTLVGQYGDLLAAFERGTVITAADVETINEKLRTLLEEVEVDGVPCWELGPVGQLYLTGFRLRFPRPVNLPRAERKSKKEPVFGNDHHSPEGFKDYVRKVWREVGWITTCHSISFHGQAAIRGRGFYLEAASPESTKLPGKIVGTYKNKDFGVRFAVITTAQNQNDLIWAADYLNREYGSD